MSNKRRWIIEGLKGFAFAIAVLGFIVNLLTGKIPFSNNTSFIIIGILTIIYIGITIWGEKNRLLIHIFEKGSSPESTFFLNWYSQRGVLSIFCVDLLWLDNNTDIVNTLAGKGDHLHLYLRNYEDQIVAKLFKSGAYVYKVKDKIKSNHRFSILDDEGIKSIIIRNKETEENYKNIEIQEYRNHAAFYDLAADMLDDCYDRVSHVSTNSKLE
jgi:hypothetical protein